MTEGPSNLPKEVAKRYEPTSQERAALEAYFDHKKEAPPCPRMNVTKGDDGVGEITIDHAEPGLAWTVLTQALGATELTFASTLTCQLSNAVAKGGSATDGLNFMLSVVNAVRPKDELESLLAAQMAAVHVATMTMAARLAASTTIKQQDRAERALNKLARTFAAQLEALRRYRTGGEQRVTVQHVSVNDNAQAIVGHVSTGGGGDKKK
jgi:hypothetical protein